MLTLEPREAFVDTGTLRLHYLTWGDGPRTVVCLHGTGGHGWHWGPLARSLVPDGFRVIGFDQRGHGDSDQPERGYEVEDFAGDLEGALPRLGVARTDLVGASLGSRVALAYAARNPERVGRLVVVDLSFEMPEAEQRRMIDGHRERPESFDSLDAVVEWSRTRPGRKRWTKEMHEEMAPHDVRRLPDGRWGWRYSRAAAIAGLEAARRDLWSLAAGLPMPTLLVRGAESPVLTHDVALKLARTIPRCELVEVDAGHGVPRENPVEFDRVVSEFLRRA